MKLQPCEVAHHYTRMQIVTASSQKQLTMLHEKCVWCIVKAGTESGFDRRELLNRAQNILAQLQAALRMEDSVSEGLFYIYDYAYMLLEDDGDEGRQKAIEVLQVITEAFRKLLRRM